MYGVVWPWLILMSFQAYRYGIRMQRLPEPYYFIWGSAIMGVAAIIAQANDKVGALFAWAILLGAFTAAWRQNQSLSPALQPPPFLSTVTGFNQGTAGVAYSKQNVGNAGALRQGSPR